MEPLQLSDATFKNEVINSSMPVLVDFWAVWCGPCKAIAPAITELAKEYFGKVKIAKLDVDNNQRTAMDFGIRSIPTLLIFKNGKVVSQMIGLKTKEQIITELEKQIS